jgi:hypothetical protein
MTCKICQENKIKITDKKVVSVICTKCLNELAKNPRKSKK